MPPPLPLLLALPLAALRRAAAAAAARAAARARPLLVPASQSVCMNGDDNLPANLFGRILDILKGVEQEDSWQCDCHTASILV